MKVTSEKEIRKIIQERVLNSNYLGDLEEAIDIETF
jgi:hypothetical protein